MKLLKPYLPFLALVLVAVIQALSVALADDRITAIEVMTLGVALGTAITTYVLPNASEGVVAWLKPLTAFLGAALTAVITYFDDGVLTSQEITLVALAVAGALGVTVTNGAAPKHRADEPLAA